MLNRSALSVTLLFVLLSGCSTKLGMFMSASLNPLPTQTLILDDSYAATYYRIQKGDPARSETLLFFVRGSGHASLNYYLKSYFADLPGNVTILALQKRHVGHRETGQFDASREFDRENHYPRLLSDQLQFVKAMLAQRDTSGMNVVIFGVSEGGNIAAEVAARIPSITHLMLLGSGGMKGIDEFRLWGRRNGIDFDRFYREVNKYPESIERKGIGQTYKYWASVLPIDPMESLAALKIPVLVAIGENDEMTPPESVDYLRREFERLDKHNLTVKIFADCNHLLVDSAGVSHRRSLWQTASAWWDR